jgi:phage baseplate assembly protein V
MLSDALTLAELSRRLANLLRAGKVAEADYARARLRVRIGDQVTGWLPWLTSRAGGDRAWWAPEVGEQVLVLSPDGDPAQGWALPAGFTDAAPPPADDPAVSRTVYADGAVIEYDRAAHCLRAAIPGRVQLAADGDVTAQVGGELVATVAGSARISADARITLSAPSIVLQADALSMTGRSGGATAADLRGQFRLAGDLDQRGSQRVDGAIKATGEIKGNQP